MTIRFCPTCQTEVEERDGHCLLGHPLRLSAPAAPLSELRAEVDKAFEAARAEIAATVMVTEVPGVGAVTPPPPPPPQVPTSRFEMVWQQLAAEEPAAPSDPITAFAPPPRMDWGPQRGSKREKFRLMRSRETKLA